MKRNFTMAIALATLALAFMAMGQDARPTANPVSGAVKQQLERRSKIMLAAADLMPADKYSFKPTPEQITYGHLVLHTAIANGKVCSAISGATAPTISVKDDDPKEKIVQALKESFDFCSTSLANVDDSKLGDEVSLFGGKATRARALIELPIDWADHYSAQAMYLRLNGILPPTAQPKK